MTNINNGNESKKTPSCCTQDNLDNVLKMSSNMRYKDTGIFEVNDDIQNVSSETIEICEEDIQNVSPNPIYQNISSNICYEASEKIIPIRNECYATLKEV